MFQFIGVMGAGIIFQLIVIIVVFTLNGRVDFSGLFPGFVVLMSPLRLDANIPQQVLHEVNQSLQR